MRESEEAAEPPLVVEQPLLAPQLAAVADQRAVGADDAVARHEDRDLIGAIGPGDGADGRRAADAIGDLAVAARLAARDLAQRRPHLRRKRRAALDDAGAESGASAGEVFGQLARQRVAGRRRAVDDRAAALLDPPHLG